VIFNIINIPFYSFQRLASSAVKLSPIAPPGAADLVLLTEKVPEDLVIDISKVDYLKI
jgi:hypothetical protein